ncbi:MAG: aspartate 1-decarboxylase [Candidatus Saccharimonadaceae bacterium]
MLLHMLKAKLHKGTVTEANINYTGSITIDSYLLKESGILPMEKVQVVNINNGERFETYVIEGEEHSGVICLNGAAARLVLPGDKVIIMSYCICEQKEAENLSPTVFILNDKNEIAQRI